MTEQILFNILISFATYTIIVVSFEIIYSTIKLFHFAHAIIFTSGAYFAFLFIQLLDWSFYTAIPAAIILALLLGCLMELFIYKPCKREKSFRNYFASCLSWYIY